MIAALGMYERAETAAAHDRLWAGIRDALRAAGGRAPQALTRGALAFMPAWTSPDLLVSQTCSLPFRARLADQVQIIATPDYGLPDCPPGHYNSVYVKRVDDPRRDLAAFSGSAFAVNEALSHSGWAAPSEDHRAQGLALCPSLITGAHRASALAVAQGRADYAALDALSWALMRRYDRFAADLQVFGQTQASPALPYITAAGRDVDALRAALAGAIAALDEQTRQILHLNGLAAIPAAAYLALPIPPPLDLPAAPKPPAKR